MLRCRPISPLEQVCEAPRTLRARLELGLSEQIMLHQRAAGPKEQGFLLHKTVSRALKASPKDTLMLHIPPSEVSPWDTMRSSQIIRDAGEDAVLGACQFHRVKAQQDSFVKGPLCAWQHSERCWLHTGAFATAFWQTVNHACGTPPATACYSHGSRKSNQQVLEIQGVTIKPPACFRP